MRVSWKLVMAIWFWVLLVFMMESTVVGPLFSQNVITFLAIIYKCCVKKKWAGLLPRNSDTNQNVLLPQIVEFEIHGYGNTVWLAIQSPVCDGSRLTKMLGKGLVNQVSPRLSRLVRNLTSSHVCFRPTMHKMSSGSEEACSVSRSFHENVQ